jgi:putative component of membrane protein insertase Oxa1/YidC/SpoIIIJ protein YidD
MSLGRWLNTVLGATIAWLIVAFYQRHVSPRLREGRRLRVICRFHPSCSEYGVIALRKYGAFPGLARAIDRVRRCRPDNFDTCFDEP